MKSRIVYYGVLGLFIALLLTSFVYAQCLGVTGNSGQHSFTISGTAFGVTTIGNNTWLTIDTNTGPGVDLYNVKCGNGILIDCNELAIITSRAYVFVTVSGPIVLQSCPSSLNHTVIFRGESIFY